MGAWVYYISLSACVLEIARKLFTYKRTGRKAALFLGVPAFVFMTMGMLLIAVAALATDESAIPLGTLALILRCSFLVGGLLWIAEQAFDISLFLEIQKKPRN